MKIVSTKHIKNFGQYLNYLRPTSNEEEFGIATFNGLFFFTVTESKGQKVIQESKEKYYEGLNISVFGELNKTEILVASADKGWASVVNRE